VRAEWGQVARLVPCVVTDVRQSLHLRDVKLEVAVVNPFAPAPCKNLATNASPAVDSWSPAWRQASGSWSGKPLLASDLRARPGQCCCGCSGRKIGVGGRSKPRLRENVLAPGGATTAAGEGGWIDNLAL